MNPAMVPVLFYSILTLANCPVLLAQDSLGTQKEVKVKKELKNTIRFNLTNPIIFGSTSRVLGYERTIGKHQSFSINVGQAGFRNSATSTSQSSSGNIIKSTSDKGFHTSIDYRFYPKKENKYIAPRGVFFGPYYSYNYFERSNVWDVTTNNFNGQVNTNLRLDIHTVGFQLGYQFIFWRRLALDMILIGPGTSWYSIDATVSATIEENDKETLLKDLLHGLSERFPAYEFLSFDEASFEKKGVINTTALGFRYIIHLGFRF